ncbi:hypothetical protein QAD02_011029 [Eretmocerus hayati]|uniref:Uncharacterized protein n=1 Tax=Eretmocerus hayati TaxID=131215 RepID=A0ACC2NWK3_9HYME|nr:hypothetical protein QAD02_011029 [Eretmocerus hayati]
MAPLTSCHPKMFGCFLFFLFIPSILSDNCKIDWIERGREVTDSRYVLQMSVVNTQGNLQTYFPRTNYDITIRSTWENLTFTNFYFFARNIDVSLSPVIGHLELRKEDFSQFKSGPLCKNRIVDGPIPVSKSYIRIGWQSPALGSGCIEFKAFVRETEKWYHTANLTVCQDERVALDDPGEIVKNCCACGSAKYELIFEGLWSRYTHPEHFPKRDWLAVFPIIVGASHSPDYHFWNPYNYASDGLKELAVDGHTKKLELELKRDRASVSTLIKFRGANFQNKTAKSFASLRVDKDKHVVSLVSRIDPSPDWFIGVSSLELCQVNCSWIESRTLNLYPYDAGVRDGITYEDVQGLTVPTDIIQSLNMSWPLPQNEEQSPFYDKNNNTHDLRPLAKLHFSLIEISGEKCGKLREKDDCTTEWSSWSECSADCGDGISKRTRNIRKSFTGQDCTAHLEEFQVCRATRDCPKEVSEEDCALTEWGEWSRCQKSCGQEAMTRARSFQWPDNSEDCQKQFGPLVVEEKMDCGNPPCPNDNYLCADDRYNEWMEWSPCSVTVGTGIRYRRRTIKEHLKRVPIESDDSDRDYGYSACLYDKDTCEAAPPIFESEVRRYNNLDALPNYDGISGDSSAYTAEDTGLLVDCVMSAWSPWTKCRNCQDVRTRQKTVIVHPKNGGRLCPPRKSTMETQECKYVLNNCKNR